MTSIDDRELIHGLKNSNEKYFSIFVDQYAGFLISVAKGYGLSHDEAKVAANEAAYKAIKNILQFDENKAKSLKGWLYKIAQNCALDILRQKEQQFPYQSTNEREEQGFQTSENIWDDESCQPSEKNILATEILNKALRCLSPTDQIILSDRSYGLSHNEIANRLKKTEGAVKVAYHRALARLKKQYINILESMEDEEIRLVLESYLYESSSEEAAN